MYGNKRLAIIGGDLRQAHLVGMLDSLGFGCVVCGIRESAQLGSAMVCDDYRDAIADVSAVILPLPASTDGVYINSEQGLIKNENDGDGRLLITRLIEEAGAPVFGGKLNRSVKLFAERHNKRLIDYFESETLMIRNAVPTAEGAVLIAMEHLNVTVASSHMLVVGYGRIGRALAHLLKYMGADVTVAARSRSSLASARAMGMRVLTLRENSPHRGLSALCSRGTFDAVMNTVPAIIFDSTLLKAMDRGTLIIDLASLPGGVDFEEAQGLGFDVVRALSLPGKYAPNTAGRLIGETLLELFEEEGII